jgi:DNA-binding NarL/FixJ family response regulator
MNARTPVYVHAADPISHVGLSTQLRGRPELELVESVPADPPPVGIVAAETVDEQTLELLRSLTRKGCHRIVLIVNALDDISLLAAIEAGMAALIHRSEATPTRIAQLAVNAAAGEAALPPDLLTRLFKQVSRLQHDILTPLGLRVTGLSPRETEVLKLVADGFDTDEIAQRLSYSVRTVKNILHAVTTRFHLRNRSHAVAYAMREGFI